MAKAQNKRTPKVKRIKASKQPQKRFIHSVASRFAPHSFQNQVNFINTEMPRILMTPEVYEDMYILTDEVDKEVAWLGTVEQHGNDFLITEIFLVEQETNSATAEITEEGLANLSTELINGRPDGVEVLNKIRFWGHSHVNMGTFASHQDEEQMDLFEQNDCPYFIRAIVNKKGRMEFTLFLFDEGMRINDVSWALCAAPNDERREQLRIEIAEKVGDAAVVYTRNYAPHFATNGGGHFEKIESIMRRFEGEDFDEEDLDQLLRYDDSQVFVDGDKEE